MVAADTALRTAITPEWIVCNGQTRSVLDGIVVCPGGIFSPWTHCLGCRFLEGADGDRHADRSCAVVPTAAAPQHQPEPLASWAELVIELL